MKRTVFFVSESTGITAEALGHSMLSQFEGVDFERVYMPFINTELRAKALLDLIQEAADRDGARPIIFSTMLDDQVRGVIKNGTGYFLELFEIFMEPISRELGIPPASSRDAATPSPSPIPTLNASMPSTSPCPTMTGCDRITSNAPTSS
jgi:regulator of PEP synthase PpsR (kinase-PPPase family)